MNSIKFSPYFFMNPVGQPNPSFASSAPVKYVSRSRGRCCDISMNSTHKQSIQSREHYFHAFPNYSWMFRPRPHVSNFNPDAPIECRKAAPLTPVPPRVSAKVPSDEKYAAAAKLVSSQDLSHKPWKNIAITEYDDAEFEELQARLASEVEDNNLVYTWPPDLAAYRREAEERGSGKRVEYAEGNGVPAAFYGASPTSTAGSSPMILTPTLRDYDAQILHEVLPEPEAALEKVVGLKRLRRKAPPPLRLNGKKTSQHVINEIGCTLLIGDAECTAREIRRLSPLTAAMNITSKLSAGVFRRL
ncbi:hypothetical protein DEU56DRAFT_439662 [Suillus clintonianus]|uniref:uncharacterized protein n=1 Tax=Suillus clintonianus TaxID=1904413 RepID=UPI001B87E76A|nr:uncharacterized protein DEU56DRAFT_439662 [Suillus clintonianus]KAG2132766.1 hypothetical protein DEU56DRAFT_439662 [Suillus clintonianus]